MKTIKILKGGYINEIQVIDDQPIIEEINRVKTNIIFDKTTNTFKAEWLNEIDIFTALKTEIVRKIAEIDTLLGEKTPAKIKERAQLNGKLLKERAQLNGKLPRLNRYFSINTKLVDESAEQLRLAEINVIRVELKKDYNRILEERQNDYRLERRVDYINIFNSIVPFEPDDVGNIFAFLKITGNKNYIIIEQHNSKYYEIYINIYEDGSPLEYYLLLPNFILKKIDAIEYVSKIDGYPIIHKKALYKSNLIESKLLDNYKFTQIINYYFKFLSENYFDKWLRTFGSWDRIPDPRSNVFRQFYIASDVDILKTFMISHFFSEYYNFYDLLTDDLSISDSELNVDDLTLTEHDDFSLLPLLTTRIEERSITYHNKVYEFFNLMIFGNSKNQIKLEGGVVKNIFLYLKKIESLIDPEDFIILKSIINLISTLDNDTYNKLFYTYNFYKLNSLHRIATVSETYWTKQKTFFDNIKKLNEFIKYDINQVKLIFFIKLIEELFDYKKLMNSLKTLGASEQNNFFKVTLWYLYFYHLEKTLIVKNLTNLTIQFKLPTTDNVILKKDYSNIELFRNSSLPLFYESLENTDSDLFGYKQIFYNAPHAKRSTINPIDNQYIIISYCGEITVLNFLMILIYDKESKLLKPDYLPLTVRPEIKSFFTKYTNIKSIDNKKVLIEFYQLIENIPFNIVLKKNGFDIDEDDSYLQIYHYAIKNDTNFEKGIELRMNYFNFCRIISYLFNATDELSTSNIETNGVDENTMKNLISLINPVHPKKNIILESYAMLTANPDFYGGSGRNPIEITIFNVTFTLGQGHAYPTLKNSKLEKKLFKGMGTYYDNSWDSSEWDILKSIYVSISKEHSIFSEINSKNVIDTDYIKFLTILKGIQEDYRIPRKLLVEFIDNHRIIILQFIFNNFKIVDDNKWVIYMEYFYNKIPIEEFDTIIVKYLKNAILKNKKMSREVFKICVKLPVVDFIKIESHIPPFIILNNISYIEEVNAELFTYVTRDISIFKKSHLIKYIKDISNINYSFLDKFDESIFNTPNYTNLNDYNFNVLKDNTFIYIALQTNNIILIKYLLSKKIDLTMLNKGTKTPYDAHQIRPIKYYIHNQLPFNNVHPDYIDVLDFIKNKTTYILIKEYNSKYFDDIEPWGDIKLLANSVINFINSFNNYREDEDIVELIKISLIYFKENRIIKKYVIEQLLLKTGRYIYSSNHKNFLICMNFKDIIVENFIEKVIPSFITINRFDEVIINKYKDTVESYYKIIKETITSEFSKILDDDINYVLYRDIGYIISHECYTPLLLDLYKEGKINPSMFCRGISFEESKITLIIEYLRRLSREEKCNLLIHTNNSEHLVIIFLQFLKDYNLLEYSQTRKNFNQNQIRRLLGFFLRNMFICYDNELYIMYRSNIIPVLHSFIIDLFKFKVSKMNLLTIYYKLSIINTILETHSTYLIESKGEKPVFAFIHYSELEKKNDEFYYKIISKVKKEELNRNEVFKRFRENINALRKQS